MAAPQHPDSGGPLAAPQGRLAQQCSGRLTRVQHARTCCVSHSLIAEDSASTRHREALRRCLPCSRCRWLRLSGREPPLMSRGHQGRYYSLSPDRRQACPCLRVKADFVISRSAVQINGAERAILCQLTRVDSEPASEVQGSGLACSIRPNRPSKPKPIFFLGGGH